MRSTQVTLFVLVMMVLGTQSFRHVYVRWIEPRSSVLDEFREPVEESIEASKSLAELKALYAKARTAKKEYEAGKSLRDIQLARETNRGAYSEESTLREAIERLEEQDRSLFRLWFYWSCGLAGILLGIFAFARVNAWLGMVGIITGFAEMAVWTSPLWRSWGPQEKFDHLLDVKLALSLVSLAMLTGLWLWNERRTGRTAQVQG